MERGFWRRVGTIRRSAYSALEVARRPMHPDFEGNTLTREQYGFMTGLMAGLFDDVDLVRGIIREEPGRDMY